MNSNHPPPASEEEKGSPLATAQDNAVKESSNLSADYSPDAAPANDAKAKTDDAERVRIERTARYMRGPTAFSA